MDDFDQLLRLIDSCSSEQKQRIFERIRDEITIHPFEHDLNVRAEIVLEAISRASDITQRGVRGVIAEATFVLEILPTASGWEDRTPEGDHAFDALATRRPDEIRIQVKMQRKKNGRPMKASEGYRDLPADHHVVEVQRTRGGKDSSGTNTRPYRYGEFDLLAVCMEASTGEWRKFMYCPERSLKPDPEDPSVIRKFQAIPEQTDGIWTDNLTDALARSVDLKSDSGN